MSNKFKFKNKKSIITNKTQKNNLKILIRTSVGKKTKQKLKL